PRGLPSHLGRSRPGRSGIDTPSCDNPAGHRCARDLTPACEEAAQDAGEDVAVAVGRNWHRHARRSATAMSRSRAARPISKAVLHDYVGRAYPLMRLLAADEAGRWMGLVKPSRRRCYLLRL